MNAKVLLVLYVLLATVQLAVPIGQIRTYEDILKTGELYRFRTAPVDPYDAFRGRYVELSYADTVAVVRRGDYIDNYSPAYVSLSRDADGFVWFGELSADPPDKGDYLRVMYQRIDRDLGDVAHFTVPFDWFFMEETQAPLAEDAYRKHVGRGNQNDRKTYVSVRVKAGRGVIEDLYIDNTPIREFLKKTTDSSGRNKG